MFRSRRLDLGHANGAPINTAGPLVSIACIVPQLKHLDLPRLDFSADGYPYRALAARSSDLSNDLSNDRRHQLSAFFQALIEQRVSLLGLTL